MNVDPMSEGLLRQRRNVVSISCVLIFLKFAGVEIDKLTFLGLDFGKLGNPSALYLALWIFYAYFIFRYYQYFSQEGKSRLVHYYDEDLERRVIRHAGVLAKNVNEKASFCPHQLSTLKNEDWKIQVTYDAGEDGFGGRKTEVENIVFPSNRLLIYRLLALRNISLNSSAITDYVLPFAIAISAFIYCFHGSNSSLLESIKNGMA